MPYRVGMSGAAEVVANRPWRRYVACGDSFTEGLCDPADGSGHPWRGWADRLAEALAQSGQPLEYANLAVRGRLLTQILDEQVPRALALSPDLVSLIGGGNDVMRPGVDVDALAVQLDAAVAELRAAGADVLLSTAYDPGRMRVLSGMRGRSGAFTAHVWTIAHRHGARVLDLWGMSSLYHPQMWAPDRVHLTAEGHRRVALLALHALGRPAEGDWAEPLPPLPVRGRREVWREDLVWVRTELLPWVGRRLRGRSSGDGLPAKRPEPTPVG